MPEWIYYIGIALVWLGIVLVIFLADRKANKNRSTPMEQFIEVKGTIKKADAIAALGYAASLGAQDIQFGHGYPEPPVWLERWETGLKKSQER